MNIPIDNQKKKKTYDTQEEEEGVCKIVYALYQLCYNLGTQVEVDECEQIENIVLMEADKKIDDNIMDKFVAALIARTCGIACAEGSRHDAMPSYMSFSREYCN